MKVKAYIKKSGSDPIQLGEIEHNPAPTDLVIKTTHVGLSAGDLYILDDVWGVTKYPTIGTGETIGVVETVGSKTRGFSVGDRVGVSYIHKTCLVCRYCRAGLEHYCKDQVNMELGAIGGFAEKITIDYRFAVKIPKGLSSEKTTPLICSGLTVYSAIKKARLVKGSRVGIIGMGGLGCLALKVLTIQNFKVSLFSSSYAKKQVALKLGASKFIKTSDLSKTKKDREKYELILNTSPGKIYLNTYLDMLEPEGSFCYIGLPFEDQIFRAAKLADYSSRRIYGSYVGSLRELKELLQFAVKYNLEAEIITMPISDFSKAIRHLKSKENYKKVVLYW